MASGGPLRAAIVGTGPSGAYAARALLDREPTARITLIDRLPTPFGLVRAGVAPDHAQTKTIAAHFRSTMRDPRIDAQLGVEVGTDVSVDELAAHHHAVIYATGMSGSNALDIPGEDLPGSATAYEFVAWYNGHPDHRHRTFDLSSPRVVVVGNGNVALDIARILATPPSQLAATDIAEHALDALAASAVEEIVVLGRRGPAQSAYSNPEFAALALVADLQVEIDAAFPGIDERTRELAYQGATKRGRLKATLARELAQDVPRGDRRRIVLRYLATPEEILGPDRVRAVRVRRNLLAGDPDNPAAVPSGWAETLDTSLVLRSIGFRGAGVPGLPVEEGSGRIPNSDGRVEDAGSPVRGQYVVGWVKRGPSGVIGTNKTCAEGTVDLLVADYRAGLLGEPASDAASFGNLVRRRRSEVLGMDGWDRIDRAERDAGAVLGRPRLKLVDPAEMLRHARS